MTVPSVAAAPAVRIPPSSIILNASSRDSDPALRKDIDALLLTPFPDRGRDLVLQSLFVNMARDVHGMKPAEIAVLESHLQNRDSASHPEPAPLVPCVHHDSDGLGAIFSRATASASSTRAFFTGTAGRITFTKTSAASGKDEKRSADGKTETERRVVDKRVFEDRLIVNNTRNEQLSKENRKRQKRIARILLGKVGDPDKLNKDQLHWNILRLKAKSQTVLDAEQVRLLHTVTRLFENSLQRRFPEALPPEDSAIRTFSSMQPPAVRTPEPMRMSAAAGVSASAVTAGTPPMPLTEIQRDAAAVVAAAETAAEQENMHGTVRTDLAREAVRKSSRVSKNVAVGTLLSIIKA